MPWTPDQFRARHNHNLTDTQAAKAAAIANAMLKRGVAENIAIATANKHARGILARHDVRHPRTGRFVPARNSFRSAMAGGGKTRPTQ